MTQNHDNAHFNMLEQQIRPSEVLAPKVYTAIDSIDRSYFFDEALSGLAHADAELPIGFGQMMLPPVLQARMLQALDIKPTESVLEIGTGNGYFTALLAQLAKHVTTVEIIAELSQQAQQRLDDLSISNVEFAVADASIAFTMPDRMDLIVITAACVEIPESYLHALTIGGRLFAVVGQGKVMKAQLVTRVAERDWQTLDVFETTIPAMINGEPKPQFEF